MRLRLALVSVLLLGAACGGTGAPAAARPAPTQKPATPPAESTGTATTTGTPPSSVGTAPAPARPGTSGTTGSTPVTVTSSITPVRAAEFASSLSTRKTTLITAGRRITREEVGYYMDVQEARLRQLGSNGLKVTRNELSITVELPGALTFESGSARLSPRAAALLASVAKVLSDYRFSVVSVHGYTDNSGDSVQNQALSEARAIAVARQLYTDSVSLDRLLVVGHGSADPAISNDTPEGREVNRRIVLQVDPLVP